MRRTLQGFVLMLALSVPIYAGDMQCPIVEPTPRPASAVQDQPVEGVISTPLTAEAEATQPVLALLEILLAVF